MPHYKIERLISFCSIETLKGCGRLGVGVPANLGRRQAPVDTHEHQEHKEHTMFLCRNQN
jgi:hypothetical protein